MRLIKVFALSVSLSRTARSSSSMQAASSCSVSFVASFVMGSLYEGNRHSESRRPQPLLVEHGVLRIPGWQRLRGTLYQMRHLCADEGAGSVRPNPRFVPSGLHHERSGRCDRICAAVHPCLRRTLLRLRVQKERVTDDEGEGNPSFP